MLNRQRVLLCMLDKAGGTASRLQLTKWAFLASEESSLGDNKTFYRFLPYDFGPFSFCLYQEMGALVRDGYVEEPDATRWKLLEPAFKQVLALDQSAKEATAKVLSRYGRVSTSKLIASVYDRYKWFTLNSKHDKRVRLPRAVCAVYTAGYAGLLIDAFLDGLLRRGIRRIIDVRKNPVSRRYGFHKSTLNRLCGYVNIDYRHFPQLGIKSDQRQHLNSQADYDRLFDQYEKTVLKSEHTAIQEIASLMREKASVLVCAEANPNQCHRTWLAKTVSRESSLPVNNLKLTT